MTKIENLINMRFGRLLVVSFSHSNKHAYWKCLCDCGNEKVIRASHLKDKTTVSCGCYARENAAKRNITHGHTVRNKGATNNSPTYRSWHSMMMRCHNPNVPGFEYWGGRGITVCVQWLKFSGFLADMGIRPDGTTIDRIDPDGNYNPGNCRWASFTTQARNKRREEAFAMRGVSYNGLLSFGS